MADPITMDLSLFDPAPPSFFGMRRVAAFSTAYLVRFAVAATMELDDFAERACFDPEDPVITSSTLGFLNKVSDYVRHELRRRAVGAIPAESPDAAWVRLFPEDEYHHRILTAIDLVELVRRHGGFPAESYQPYDDVVVGPCPFKHEPGERGTLFIVPQDKFWYCPACEWYGDAFNFVAARFNIAGEDLTRFLAKEAGVPRRGEPDRTD